MSGSRSWLLGFLLEGESAGGGLVVSELVRSESSLLCASRMRESSALTLDWILYSVFCARVESVLHVSNPVQCVIIGMNR